MAIACDDTGTHMRWPKTDGESYSHSMDEGYDRGPIQFMSWDYEAGEILVELGPTVISVDGEDILMAVPVRPVPSPGPNPMMRHVRGGDL